MDGSLEDLESELPAKAKLGNEYKWFVDEMLPAWQASQNKCGAECEIPDIRKLFSANYPSDAIIHEICTCETGGSQAPTVAHFVNGLSKPWSCKDRCFGVAPQPHPTNTDIGKIEAHAADCATATHGDHDITIPSQCMARVCSSPSKCAELPAGSYSANDLLLRGVFETAGDRISEVKLVSNRAPDCTEEVLLRLLMVEQMEPGLDDSHMTPEEKFVYGNATRYNGFTKFRFSKMAPSMVRMVFHDAGDYDNLETMDGKSVDIGQSGFDGCLHTFREHAGTPGSFKMKNDDAPPTDPQWKDKLPDMDINHNKAFGDNLNILAFLRLHSANDMGDPNLYLQRKSYFWDNVLQGPDKASNLPRLTRPDVMALGANVALEAMFGLSEPIGMQYGRWYGEACAGRPPADAGNTNAVTDSARRRWASTRAGGRNVRKLIAEGIEASGAFSRVIKTPFQLHEDHKDHWCPAANELPSVKDKMGLSDAESVSLFGAHSIGRVERVGHTRCNYMTNGHYCPSMCPKINEGGGLKYAQGWAWDDSPELLDNRYFANIMDQDFESLPHCAALGETDADGGPVPEFTDSDPSTLMDGLLDEGKTGIVRLGVMGMGCNPQAWSPVVDPSLTRTCVAGHKVTWKEQSPCEVHNCVDKCISEKNKCTHAFEDSSQQCRDCKFDCSDWFSQNAPRNLKDGLNRTSVWEETWGKRRPWGFPDGSKTTYDKQFGLGWMTPPVTNDLRSVKNASELKEFRWCHFTGSNEHQLQVGQMGVTADKFQTIAQNPQRPWNLYTPGPLDPHSRAWARAGMTQNIEQIALVHGNPTPIFNMPVDYSLLGDERTKKWVRNFGKDNALFHKTFSSAWNKITGAGWNHKGATSGWSGGDLHKCRETPCTANAGKFWCPVNILGDRLPYLAKPASLRLELGNCKAAADSTSKDDTPVDSSPGACKLVGGFGVRGTVQCGGKKYHCCSKRACEFEQWLVQHRKADKSEEPTCPFTAEAKDAEVKRTVKAWHPEGAAQPVKDPKDIGIDYHAAQQETWQALLAHERKATKWFYDAMGNGTLPDEFSCPWDPARCYPSQFFGASCPNFGALSKIEPPTAKKIMNAFRGLIRQEGGGGPEGWSWISNQLQMGKPW